MRKRWKIIVVLAVIAVVVAIVAVETLSGEASISIPSWGEIKLP